MVLSAATAADFDAVAAALEDSRGITSLIIFGASGDLTRRKLMPALCNLYSKGRIRRELRIVGVARADLTTAEYREFIHREMLETGGFQPNQAEWDDFSAHITYLMADVVSQESLRELESHLEELENFDREVSNRLYYLAIAPSLYQAAITGLQAAGMADDSAGWRRIVVEKPFGVDLATARELNAVAHSVFQENQVFRIDHYLGKETVQNLLVFRFANTIFEPIWNRNYIDHVQITVAESLNVSERADYYDQTGVLRDMFQNHLMQLLSLVAMEPPHTFEADALRNEKAKVLKSIRRIRPEDIGDNLIAGQYQGYRQEPGVAEDSRTPTYAALRLFVDNWRWQGVPFYLRSGKAMEDKTTEIIIQFRHPPHILFPLAENEEVPSNTLAICVQPDEGFRLEFQSKVPDAGLRMRKVELEFHYQEEFGGGALPDAYERLLMDALNGDAALFTRGDEIEQAWGIMDPLIAWLHSPAAPPPHPYAPGAWGPEAAEQFLAADGRVWLRGCCDH